MKLVKWIFIGLGISVLSIIAISIFSFNLGFAGIFALPWVLLAIVPTIIFGSIIVGILAQTNKIERGYFSKHSLWKIPLAIIVGFISFIIIMNIIVTLSKSAPK